MVRQSRVVGGVLGAPLTAVLEEENDAVGASDVTRCSEGGGSIELNSNESNSNVGAVGGDEVAPNRTSLACGPRTSNHAEMRQTLACVGVESG